MDNKEKLIGISVKQLWNDLFEAIIIIEKSNISIIQKCAETLAFQHKSIILILFKFGQYCLGEFS